MRKYILSVILSLTTFISISQTRFTGIWVGKMNVGTELRIVFYIKQDESKNYTAVIDLPDQGLKGIVSKDVSVKNDSLTIIVKDFQGSYSGKLRNDTTIAGSWKQGISTPLELKKVEKVETVQRPQTPIPPFSYKSEDIVYSNKDGSVQYGATITIPSGKGPFPAVVLITGSGQQNRDEEIFGHKPFAVIADQLTKNGFVVLRADDRGVGQTTGMNASVTTLDFCDDVSVGLDYLIGRKEVNKNKLALIGHSEGGMIAPILAAKRKDITAIVLMAAPGKPTTELLIEQNEAILTSMGFSKEYLKSYLELYSAILYLMKNNNNKDSAKTMVSAQVEGWMQRTNKNIVVATTGIMNDERKAAYIDAMVEAFSSSWFKYFLNYEPQQYIEKLTCKVFAINGSKDVQVISKTNLAGIEASLKKSKSKGYLIKEYEGLNHLFQKCKLCSTMEYGKIDETISPAVLKDITDWLKAEM
ncbi:MAG TPA: alpha/beta fold hydrolase [Chitinophagaceae bacterium]